MLLPLQGIRVVDLSRVFAMPYVGAYLADLGAEVIKVDTHYSQFVDTTRTLNGPYPDNQPGDLYWERGGTFQTLNRGKLSVTLDLRADRGLELLKQLIGMSDVVLENYTPHVTRRFGLGYAQLRDLNPRLIMVSNTGYGHTGPWSDYGAMASALEPTHGTGAFTAYLEPDSAGNLRPSEIPNKIGNSYTDFLACWTAQIAILASLLHRESTGQGLWIDLSMYQVGVSFIGEGLLDFAHNGRRARRLGNRHPYLSPHGCYPCQGDDQWVTLTARDETEWRALCRAMGQPQLGEDPRFSDPLVRYRHQDELDQIVAAWTSAIDSKQVMERLQEAGVPAGPVFNARQLLTDPHLRARKFFESTDHPERTGLGVREYIGRGWKLSGTEPHIQGPAPMLGDNNEYVLGTLLGLDSEQISSLREDGVIGETLTGAVTPAAVPLARQEELGWIVSHDPGYQDVLDSKSTDSEAPGD